MKTFERYGVLMVTEKNENKVSAINQNIELMRSQSLELIDKAQEIQMIDEDDISRIRSSFSEILVIAQVNNVDDVSQVFKDWCDKKFKITSENTYENVLEFAPKRAEIYKKLISDCIISNPNLAPTLGVIKEVFEGYAEISEKKLSELLQKTVDASKEAIKLMNDAIELKKEVIADKLSKFKEVTEANYTCSCGYEGQMGINGTKGKVYKKYLMTCPECDAELVSSADEKNLKKYRLIATGVATVLLFTGLIPISLILYIWALFANDSEGFVKFLNDLFAKK